MPRRSLSGAPAGETFDPERARRLQGPPGAAMRRIFPVVLAVICAAVGATAASLAVEEITPRKLRRASASSTKGFQALARGDLSRASELFEDSLKTVRGFPNARVGLGHVAYARRHYAAALAHYTTARDEFTRLQAAALDAEFRTHEQSQRKIRALEDDIRTLQSLPNANVADQVRELQRAIEYLQRVRMPVRREADEPPAEVFYHRGNALFQLGRTEEAVADWETCARLAPKFPAVHNNLAVARWKLGHLLLARTELARARALGARIDPRFEKSLFEDPSPAPPESGPVLRP